MTNFGGRELEKGSKEEEKRGKRLTQTRAPFAPLLPHITVQNMYVLCVFVRQEYCPILRDHEDLSCLCRYAIYLYIYLVIVSSHTAIISF